MAHDVLWLSMCIDHPDEIAVHMEDGRNPDRSEAGNTGSRTLALLVRGFSQPGFPTGASQLRRPANLLLRSRRFLVDKKKPPPNAGVSKRLSGV